MFAPISAYPPVCVGWQPCAPRLPASFAVQGQCYTGNRPKSCAGKPPARPALRKIKKKSAVARWQSAYMHFASIYMLHKAPGKALFGTNSSHFSLLWPLYGSEKAHKLRGAPTKYRQECVKITQKWSLGAFWTIWRPFLSLLYRFPRE